MTKLRCCVLFASLCLAGLHAQQGGDPRIRVLAQGQGATAGDALFFAARRDDLVQRAQQWGVDLPAVAMRENEAAVLLLYGDGAGGEPRLSIAQWGAQAREQLLRVRGGDQAAAVVGRWVLLAVPAALAADAGCLRVERDFGASPATAGWCAVGTKCAARSIAASGVFPTRGNAHPACLQDVAQSIEFARAYLAPDVVLPDCDFASQVLLALPIAQVSPDRDAGHAPSLRWLCSSDSTLVALMQPPASGDGGRALGLFAVPRVAGELTCERLDDRAARCWRPLARFVVESSAAPLLLRFSSCRIPEHLVACERAASATDLARLRTSLGIDAAVVADNWCDFEHAAVLAVVLPSGSLAGVGIGTEEGVDVVTITTGNRAAGAGKSTCLLFAVARRTAQMAIVLRPDDGSTAERTLRVLQGL